MSTISTVVFKKSSSTSVNQKSSSKGDLFTSFVSISLWTIAAIITAAGTDMSPNAHGIAVSFTVQDVITMLITTWLLLKGLTEYNHLYVIPWILISIWNMHSCHYASIVKMVRVLRVTKTRLPLPWIALAIDMFSLILRAALTFRIAKLSVFQWYQKSIEKEILASSPSSTYEKEGTPPYLS